jgi:predicted dehydrogenase
MNVTSGDTFQLEAAHFLDCIEQGREPISSARQERYPLRAVIATYESFRQERRVYVAEMDAPTE